MAMRAAELEGSVEEDHRIDRLAIATRLEVKMRVGCQATCANAQRLRRALGCAGAL
jgi:hypothetical protein